MANDTDGGGYESPPVDAGSGRTCPECGESFEGAMAAMRLGQHRRREHGVTGAGAHKKKTPGSAPSSSSSTPRQRTSPKARAPKFDYEGTMLAWYTMAGQMLAMRDPMCGEAVQMAAPGAAKAWGEMAKHHPGVRRFIETGTEAGGWLGLFMAHAPIVMAITEHHVRPALERRRGLLEEEGPADGFPAADAAAA